MLDTELESLSLAFCLQRDVLQNVLFEDNSRSLQEKFQVGLTKVSLSFEVEVDGPLRGNLFLQPTHVIEWELTAFDVDPIGFLVQIHSYLAGDRALPDGALKLPQENLSSVNFDLCTETVESLAVDSWLCDGNPPTASVVTQVDLFQVKLTADGSLNRDRLIGGGEETLDRDFTPPRPRT